VLDRVPIRWRLAFISAGLTFLILLAFALVVGKLTTDRIHSDFNRETAFGASTLAQRLTILPEGNRLTFQPNLEELAALNHAAIRLYNGNGVPLAGGKTPGAPDFGRPQRPGTTEADGYRIEIRKPYLVPAGAPPNSLARIPVYIVYARSLSDLDHTMARVRLFLGFGVLGGTLLALMFGMSLARRAMRPIAGLTATAQDIARTGDPDRRVPQPVADDEVAELARTLDEMLLALEASRSATEDALRRQRAFVADASHELRTPLTSVLANLELLIDELHGEPRETADGALRSAQRMRRLVTDLLLLARTDSVQERTLAPVDLATIAGEAVGEASALAAGHHLGLDAPDAVTVTGARDELHRLILNLVENAINHTPAGTTIDVRVRADGGDAVVVVEDDGPGVPADRRDHIFDRFYRGDGDRGRSTGLGLAIVRAVAQGHGGDVQLDAGAPTGARFVVRLPLALSAAMPAEPVAAAPVSTSRTRGLPRLPRRRA
jgi:signal transduction histidine kinase